MPRKNNDTAGDYTKDFPRRLREIMREKKKTQQNVADAIGKTRQAVSYYADGSSSPDWEVIVKLAKYFDVSTDWLLGLSNVKTIDGDIKGACKYTGLSDISVRHIRKLTEDKDISFILNTLWEDEFFDYLLSYMLDIKKTIRCIAINGNGLGEKTEAQEEAIEKAHEVLMDAGVFDRFITDPSTILEYQKAALENIFRDAMDIMLYNEDGILNSDYN